MKRIALCFMISFALMTNPIMAEETKEAVSVTEQNDAGDDLVSSAQALLDEGKYEEAISLLQKAADMGDAEGQAMLGVCYFDGAGVEQNYETAVNYFRLAADQDNARGQNGLGTCYDLGLGVEQDYQEAVKYYRLAADQGYATAQCNLGVCYYNGTGVEQDYEMAAKYARLAADQGDEVALSNLGNDYFFGFGVEQDYSEAYRLFCLSAEKGHMDGLFAVGECYYLGTGVEKDLEAAAEWYQKALDAGFEPRDEEEAEHLKALIPDWASAETEEAGTEAESPVTKKTVTIYDGEESKKQDIDCLFRDDMPNVPYVEVEGYLEFLFPDTDFITSENGDQFSIHGKLRDGDKTGSSMNIDVAKDTVSFEKSRDFLVGKVNSIETGFMKTEDEKVEEEKELLYNLADYNIDLLAEDGKVYLPLSTLADIMYRSYSWSYYGDGIICLARYGTSTDLITSMEDAYFNTVERPADVVDYAYNELCFQIENLYGQPGQVECKELVEKINAVGFDKALDEGSYNTISFADMKKYLMSTNIGEYGAGMLMLNILLSDGGHTKFGAAFTTRVALDPDLDQTEFAREYKKLCEKDTVVAGLIEIIKPMETEKSVLSRGLSELRENGFGNAAKSWAGDAGNDVAWLYVFDNTAVFRFDEYINDVIKGKSGSTPFNEALEYAKEKGMENFVIDLSTNTGGSSDVMGFILSMIEGTNASSYNMDKSTGYKMKSTFYADKNLDGVIDEKDEDVKYDFNYAILTSRVCFSNGNTLPVLASEAGIPLLGEKTGGGGCSMCFYGVPGAAGNYMVSSVYLMVNSKYEDIDAGVEPTYQMLTVNEDGTIADAAIYDPAAVVSTLNQHFDSEK